MQVKVLFLHVSATVSHQQKLQPTLKSNNFIYGGFEILGAVVNKGFTLRDAVPCSPSIINLQFRGTCSVHLQCRMSKPIKVMKQVARGAA